MKKLFYVLTFFLFFSIFTTNEVIGSPDSESEDRFIVGFEEEIDFTLFEDIPYEVHYIHEEIDAVTVTGPVTEIKALQGTSEVKWVEKDRIVKTEGQLIDWGYKATETTEAKELNLTGEGVKVAVIDTGISTTHPDLDIAGGITFVDETYSYDDDNGHGTHVAGVIAAQNNDIGTLGVSPAVELYAVKALDEDGMGNQTDVMAGIEWAMDNEVDIINLSITSPYSSIAMKTMLEEAKDQGIIVVAASGNEETGNGQTTEDIMYPARYDSVIGVGAVNEELYRAEFSYVGPSLSYTAPGEDIYSTYITNADHPDGYAVMSGTSMATPYAAGIIALYKQNYPDMANEKIIEIVSKEVMDLGAGGKDIQYGYGLIQSPDKLFWDMEEAAWYTPYVNYLVIGDLINGYTDGTFRPGNKITREEVVTMIGRALGLNGERRETVFTDVKVDYFGSGYIDSAYDENIVTGYPDQTFRPKSAITRGEVAVIIDRAFDFPEKSTEPFTDVHADKYYYEAVHVLKAHNLITGYNDGKFRPEQEISRAEFSAILAKTLNENLR
ncbi:S8 family peptidase [Thalassobacillus pellis]|uniref:S8 family peptidase n=1 Tax=Thalassobacillus pellis TaxID=748008 RepID=UPI0019604C92|nr:S8 family serine peptidase [Thalassobacillus pellis]MBM7551686.1 hypothetical protein [Thalassobacillus pellis]